MDLHLLLLQHLDPGQDQKASKGKTQPSESIKQRRSQQDKHQPHDESAENPPEKNAMLQTRRHRKIAEDKDKEKDVVHAERIFDEIAGQELQPSLVTETEIDTAVEYKSQAVPDERPDHGFPIVDLVSSAVEDCQVQ